MAQDERAPSVTLKHPEDATRFIAGQRWYSRDGIHWTTEPPASTKAGGPKLTVTGVDLAAGEVTLSAFDKQRAVLNSDKPLRVVLPCRRRG